MADLIAIINSQPIFIKLYKEAKRVAELNAPIENSCATSIQRLFRGITVRIDIKFKSNAATELERVFRGHLGRNNAHKKIQDKIEFRQISLYQYFTIQIQKCYRGYYSRKYRKNYWARKTYFKGISDKNQEVLDMMSEYAEEQILRDKNNTQELKDRSFHDYAENLHHLVSTRNTRGVFNPPEHLMETPTLNDIPVENHIRGVVKDLLRTRGFIKSGLIRDLNGSLKVPYVGLKNRLSLQASAPYNIHHQEVIKEKTLHKILVNNKDDFLAGGSTTKLLVDFTPLHAKGEPYMDPGSNPLLIRGVPENQQELLNSTITQKPLFVKKLEKPFFSRTGGNKSTALPNDLFEVIAEAEETGNSTIPMPPPRLSAVQHTKRIVMKKRSHIIKVRTLQTRTIQENNNDRDQKGEYVDMSSDED